MGVGQYISDTFSSIFFKSVLRHLANIKRPYYQRSLYLLFACQSLPEPPSNSGQRQELKECVVSAIQFGKVLITVRPLVFSVSSKKQYL